jgi:hypothetical protein
MEPMDTSESPKSPQPSTRFVHRRRHMKSRNGCVECKKRKVKVGRAYFQLLYSLNLHSATKAEKVALVEHVCGEEQNVLSDH